MLKEGAKVSAAPGGRCSFRRMEGERGRLGVVARGRFWKAAGPGRSTRPAGRGGGLRGLALPAFRPRRPLRGGGGDCLLPPLRPRARAAGGRRAAPAPRGLREVSAGAAASPRPVSRALPLPLPLPLAASGRPGGFPQLRGILAGRPMPAPERCAGLAPSLGERCPEDACSGSFYGWWPAELIGPCRCSC